MLLSLVMTLIKFAMIGGLGFIFDALFFYLLLQLSFAPMLARVLAFWLAATITWLGNRHFTFACTQAVGALTQWVKHMLSAHGSGVLNLCIFYLMQWHYSIEVSFVCGIVSGAAFNYWLSNRYVFTVK